MKVLFAGPSTVGLPIPEDIWLRGPAAQGDILQATLEGVTVIGLVDGRFDEVASVWHKEILFALSKGVHVCGAASMGALRAAECDAFGMVGLGAVYQRYARGELDDDAAVAQLHAPEELGYVGLTEPLVNAEATIDTLRRTRQIDAAEAKGLMDAAAALNFRERTYGNMVNRLPTLSAERRLQIAAALENGRTDVKRSDAQALIIHMQAAPARRGSAPAWRFQVTQLFQSSLHRALASTQPFEFTELR